MVVTYKQKNPPNSKGLCAVKTTVQLESVISGTWMSRDGSDRIKGDRISGCVTPKEY